MQKMKKFVILNSILIALILAPINFQDLKSPNNPPDGDIEIAQDEEIPQKRQNFNEDNVEGCSGLQSGKSPTENRFGNRNEQNVHGGSWLDTFNDASKIDLPLSDTINISDGEVKLIDTGYLKVFEDDFSMPLDSSKWINNSGNGTKLYSFPKLKAVKNNQAQTSEAYIQTRGSWNFMQIVEWEWNSVYDSAPNSYAHHLKICLDVNNRYKTILVDIRANREIHIRDWDKWLYSSSPLKMNANTWYKMKLIILDDYAKFEVRDMTNTIFLQTPLYSNVFPSHQTGAVDITFAAVSGASSYSFETQVDNFKIYENKFYSNGNLTSKIIKLQPGMKWDKLVIDKSEPSPTLLSVSILNPISNQPITGFKDIVVNGELDISESGEYHGSKPIPGGTHSLRVKRFRAKAALN
jgi:hypothetical protein